MKELSGSNRALRDRGVDGRRPAAFVGRVRERRLLATAVRAVAVGGTAGLIVGEAGIGKTALLRAVAADVAAERDARVVWVRGLESETVLPYAAAADLLTPLKRRFAALPATQRQALEVALALAEGPPPNVLAACAGALGVLAAASDKSPLVVVVDDLQWVDPESAQLLLFVARRLIDERVVMLIAVRSEPGTAPPAPDLPSLQLGGLGLEECRELARCHGLRVPDEVLGPVVVATGGNPLAVLETLSDGPSRWTTDGEQHIAVGGSGERAWRAVLAGLPEASRRALFVTVVSRARDLGELSDVLAAVGLSLADLEPARSRDLLRSDKDGVRLLHPLLRGVLLDATPLDVRLRVYRALADVGPPDLRAWYLSLGAVGPDQESATRLVVAASQARRHRGYGAAMHLSKRAADLTGDASLRGERLLLAATDAQLAGDAPAAVQWSEQAMDLRADGRFCISASLVHGRALASMGRPADARDALVGAGRRAAGAQPDGAAELFAEAVVPASLTGDVEACLAAAELSESARTGDGAASLRSRVLVTHAHVVAGTAQARSRLAGLREAARAADPVEDAEALALLARCRCWCEDDDGARSAATLAVDGARRGGAPAVLALGLAVRSESGYWAGRWAAALADAAESLQWSAEIGHPGATAHGYVALARLEAAQGDRDQAEEHVDASRRCLGPLGIDGLRVHEAAVLGFAALGEGEAEAAAEHLEAAWAAAHCDGRGHPNALPFVPDLVEAYVRSGCPESAVEPLAWLRERAEATGSTFGRAAAARLVGLLAANVEDARAAFARARDLHRERSMPFELARTLLCEGEVLRRGRHGAAARPVLREAATAFEALGARPWARRAAAELAATGARPAVASVAPPALTQLTPQELQIARMVASGRNNVEAAAALYVSRKTVEAHLTRVYRKLSVHSRTELTAVLLRHGALD